MKVADVVTFERGEGMEGPARILVKDMIQNGTVFRIARLGIRDPRVKDGREIQAIEMIIELDGIQGPDALRYVYTEGGSLVRTAKAMLKQVTEAGLLDHFKECFKLKIGTTPIRTASGTTANMNIFVDVD